MSEDDEKDGLVVLSAAHSSGLMLPKSSMSLLCWRENVLPRLREPLLAKAVRILPIMAELPELVLAISLGRVGVKGEG